MPITQLALTCDRPDYSRYESERAVIRALVVPTPATGLAGEVLTVTLRRQSASGDRIVATVSLPLGAQDYSAGIPVSIDLRTLVDADGFMTALRSHTVGDYELRAQSGAVVASQPLTVTPITTEEMRQRFLLGLTLQSREKLAPRVQPATVTGVRVIDVSPTTAVGSATLVWTVAAKTLAWAGGAAVAVPLGFATLVLPDTSGGWIVVETDRAAMPGGNVTEALVIDLAPMPDETLLGHVLNAFDELETFLQVFLEPHIVVSRVLKEQGQAPAQYDQLADGVTWYAPFRLDQWLSIKLPLNRLLKVVHLSGWFNRTKTVTVPLDMLTFNEVSGHVELVPSNATVLNWEYTGLGFYVFHAGHTQVPQFWQYHVVAGLREIPRVLLEFGAKRSAMTLLALASHARNPAGAASSSISRDGVSESTSVNPTGLYAATIERYSKETGLVQGRDMGMERLRDRYRGIAMVTL